MKPRMMFALSGDEFGEIRDVVPKPWTQATAKIRRGDRIFLLRSGSMTYIK
jgi:hypothetical protein